MGQDRTARSRSLKPATRTRPRRRCSEPRGQNEKRVSNGPQTRPRLFSRTSQGLEIIGSGRGVVRVAARGAGRRRTRAKRPDFAGRGVERERGGAVRVGGRVLGDNPRLGERLRESAREPLRVRNVSSFPAGISRLPLVVDCRGKRRRRGHLVLASVQKSDSSSACCSTVFVAASCLSGG
jgi:hypothetical protein